MDVFFFSLQSFKMAHLKLSPTTCNTIMEPNKCYYDVTLCTTEIKTKFAAIGQNKVFERNCDAVKTWNSLLRMFALCSLGRTYRECILEILIWVILFILRIRLIKRIQMYESFSWEPYLIHLLGNIFTTLILTRAVFYSLLTCG